MNFRLQTLLVLLATCLSGASQGPEIDINQWAGSFGEMVRLLRSDESSSPDQLLRIAELMESEGMPAEALAFYRRLADGSEEFKREPYAARLKNRIVALEQTMSAANAGNPRYAALLKRLKTPLPKCHLQERDLPVEYRQAASEERLRPFISPATRTKLALEFPVLEDYSGVERFWKGRDGKTLGFLVYHELGPCLLYSLDGGKRWTGPLYVGLHRLPPAFYRILSDSRLPLIDRGRLQFEVFVSKTDWSKRGSSFREDGYLWKKWHRMLSTPLAALRKDSDGDGLTDLFEERILTDPKARDTDQDGFDDAADNQPLAPLPRELSDVDRLFLCLAAQGAGTFRSAFHFSKATGEFIRWERPAFEPKLNEAGFEFFTAVSHAAIPPTATTLVQSRRPALGSITGRNRWIVLDDEAIALYKAKFGREFEPFYHAIDRLLMDKAGTRAYLQVSKAYFGETIAFEKARGEWRMRRLSQFTWD